jgi:FkbH-like protein
VFEFQVPHRQAPDDLPEEARALFRDPDATLTGVSLLSWAEHCTECAAPACYASCDLYEARADKRCRRFEGGMSAARRVPNLQGFAVRVAFKRWAQLMARGRVRLVAPGRARWLERLLHRLDLLVARIPDHDVRILGRRSLSARLAMRLKKWISETPLLADTSARPDYFLIEVWNPGPQPVPLSVVIQNPPEPGRRPPYQRKLELVPGFTRWKLDYAEIAPQLDPARETLIHLIPNILRPEEEGRVLFFGALGFVADARYARAPAASARHVKAVAWDLDGTLWDGVLLEDGPEGVKLRPEVAQVMAELDRRGIVQSVVSKNEPGDAMAQLRRLGLDELFVFPKIGWAPKSESIAALLRDLNIGADALAFVDDSPFERAQVARAHPSVRIHTPEEAAGLSARPEFDPPRTEESSRRRQLYRDQERRMEAQSRSSGDYEAFLRECEMKLVVHAAASVPVERLHELIQRTNQLNFSGNRYSREELAARVADPRYEAFALECSDRFGDYGIVGFALLDRAASRLMDLALSCRVQGKRVEHAFLGFLLARQRERGAARLDALYRETSRNREAGGVFADLCFAERAPEDGARILGFELARELPQQSFVDVSFPA